MLVYLGGQFTYLTQIEMTTRVKLGFLIICRGEGINVKVYGKISQTEPMEGPMGNKLLN